MSLTQMPRDYHAMRRRRFHGCRSRGLPALKATQDARRYKCRPEMPRFFFLLRRTYHKQQIPPFKMRAWRCRFWQSAADFYSPQHWFCTRCRSRAANIWARSAAHRHVFLPAADHHEAYMPTSISTLTSDDGLFYEVPLITRQKITVRRRLLAGLRCFCAC